VAAGYGITPYGIGDWGSENTVIPDTNSLSIQTTAPVVDSGVIPTGGAVLVGSAPSVVIFERIKIPGSAVLGIVGHAPTVLQNFRITPAANDSILVGAAPEIDLSTIITPSTATVSVVGAASTAVIGQIAQPGTGALNILGHAPEQDFSLTPGSASVNLQGDVPGVAQSEVITPSGLVSIIGGIPSVVVQGSVRVPGVASVSLVGFAPTVTQSLVLTPSSGVLVIVGIAPIIDSPNWVIIDDSQTPRWTDISDTQTPNWQLIAA
jgi:hypothetical protein